MQECDQAHRDLWAAEARVRDLNAEIDSLSAQIDKLEPPPKPAEVIQGYIQSEQELRIKRAQEQGQPVKAALDRALARNRGRGVQRPQYPGK